MKNLIIRIFNSNIFKTFLMCMAAGVGGALAIGLVFLITDGLNLTDFTNDQLSQWCIDGFISGFLVLLAYSAFTKRQW
jgi:hypothetical protein